MSQEAPSKLIDVTVTARFRVYGELARLENGIALPVVTPDESVAYLEDAQAFYVTVIGDDGWMPQIEFEDHLCFAIQAVEEQAGPAGEGRADAD